MANISIRMGASQMNSLGDQRSELLWVLGWLQRKSGDDRSSNIPILTLHKCLQQEDISPRAQICSLITDLLKVLTPSPGIIKDERKPCPIACSGRACLFTVRSTLEIVKESFLYAPVAKGP